MLVYRLTRQDSSYDCMVNKMRQDQDTNTLYMA